MVRKLTIDNNDVPYGLFLDEPGEMSVLNVCHLRQGHCCSTPIENNQVHIRPLPYVAIEDDERIFVVSEDEEAGIPIRFQGTPPYTVQFMRKYRPESTGEDVTETFIQSDIPDDVFIFKSHLEGTYRFLAVQDRYCKWPDASTMGRNRTVETRF